MAERPTGFHVGPSDSDARLEPGDKPQSRPTHQLKEFNKPRKRLVSILGQLLERVPEASRDSWRLGLPPGRA